VNEACLRVEQIVNRWSDTGSASAQDLGAVDHHLVACTTCRDRLEPLVSFMRRDAFSGRVVAEPADAPVPDLVADVLDRLTAAPQRAGRRGRSPVLAMAAAVVLLAGLGLILYRAGVLHGSRQSGGTVIVRFELAAPDAAAVAVVGDFTGWGEGGLSLEDPDGDGVWETAVRLRPGRAYSYNFLIDGGTWIADPNASLNVEDEFGGTSSVIIL
jgi:hypothetical protein